MNVRENITESIQRLPTFVQESWAELRKVHFPSGKETQAATLVVVIGVLVVAAYLGLVDFVIAKTIQLLLL